MSKAASACAFHPIVKKLIDMTTNDRTAGVDRAGHAATAALVAVIAAGVAARAWLLWSTPLIPGMNGGYYLVQARALLEHGRLGIPDLPLTFVLQAAVAKLLQLVTGRGLEASILLSVRLCDALLPPLVAVPVFLLGRTWCARNNRGVWPAVAVAAGVVLGAPALTMVGDFEKNSLGLVWLAGLVFALHAWMARRSRGRAVTVLALLGLCGLTHIGVFGAALLLTVLTWGADVALLRVREGLRSLRHAFVMAAGGAAVVALVACLVLWKFDPSRVRRLAGALSSPVTFVQNGGHAAGQDFRGGPPPGGMPNHSQPPPGRGGPPGTRMLPQTLVTVLFGFVALGALILPWRRRRELPAADRATAFGCAASLILLTGPWIRGDMDMRLQLIAMIPAAFAAVYGLAHLPGRCPAPVCAVVALALMARTTGPLLAHRGRTIISVDAFDELRTLAPLVTRPDRTLVVARHGLEWWTAWTLHTHVAQPRAVRAADWSNYDTVLFIREKGDGRGPGIPGPGSSPEGDFRGGPPLGFGGVGGPGGRPPMMGAEIPDGAEILHDGTHFRLARVPTPPVSLDQSK